MTTGYNIREGSQMIHDRAVELGTLPARTPARGSQCERILAVLADGKLHTTAEIHERAGHSRLNSRIAELRKRGWDVKYEFVGGVGPAAHAYRLVCTEDDGSPGRPVDADPPSGVSVEANSPASSVQLFFGAAA